MTADGLPAADWGNTISHGGKDGLPKEGQKTQRFFTQRRRGAGLMSVVADGAGGPEHMEDHLYLGDEVIPADAFVDLFFMTADPVFHGWIAYAIHEGQLFQAVGFQLHPFGLQFHSDGFILFIYYTYYYRLCR